MEEALERYYKYFEENYPLIIVGTASEGEIIRRIDSRIAENKPEKDPEYEDDVDY